MSFLDKLERIFGRFALPNLALYLVIGQVFVLLTSMAGVVDETRCLLVPALVMDGEWWRLVTFWFYPPRAHFIFVAFALYIFWMMGNALEEYWGVFRFNLYILVGAALMIGAAFITPYNAATNAFIAGSVFLAFARINPDFEMMLFFILPVKIKWLALVTWLFYGYGLATGPLPTKLQILASTGNFLLFFGADIIRSMRYGQRTMARKAQEVVEAREPRHRCHACKRTDLTNPELEFRYCSKCDGDLCYCSEHLHNHPHVVAGHDATGR